MVLDVELQVRPTGQAPTICSISETSSKYVRYDRIFPSRKSATVTPANWTCRPVRFQHGILVEDEWPRVIGFDEPLGERLVAHFVESAEQDDDVGERHFAESGELSECCQPRHGGDTATNRRHRR